MDEWDRALESALEDLNDEIQSPWEAMLLAKLLPVIRATLDEHAKVNYEAGELDENMRLGEAVK